MNEIINAIPEYVITAVISTAIFYAFKYGEDFIHNKALHAKTAQSRELWGFLEQVAMTAVNSLVSADMTGQDKFNKAAGLVKTALDNQGFKNVDVKAINAAVQAAYEKSPLTTPVSESAVKQTVDGLSTTIKSVSADKISAGEIHTDFTPVAPITASAPTPAGDPVMDAIAKAPNRANDVKEAN